MSERFSSDKWAGVAVMTVVLGWYLVRRTGRSEV